MASFWFSLFLAASIAISVGAEAIVGSSEVAGEADAALLADDACGKAEDPGQQQQQCALSAVQRRGQRLEVPTGDGGASDASGPAAAFAGAGPAPHEDGPAVASAAEAAEAPDDEEPMKDGEGPPLRAGKGGHGGGGGHRGGGGRGVRGGGSGRGFRRGGGRLHPGLHPHPHLHPWHPHWHKHHGHHHHHDHIRRGRRRGWGRGWGGGWGGGYYPGGWGGGGFQPSCQTYGCRGYDATLSCQCNPHCVRYQNCCADYAQWCTGPSAHFAASAAAGAADQAVREAPEYNATQKAAAKKSKPPTASGDEA